MEGESGVTRSTVNELHSTDIQGDQIEGASGVTRRIIDAFHCLDIQGDQLEGEKMVLLEVSSMNLIPILWISKERKWKVKVVLHKVSLMNFILGRSKDAKWKVKGWCYSKYH